jgi:hypothetical protein
MRTTRPGGQDYESYEHVCFSHHIPFFLHQVVIQNRGYDSGSMVWRVGVCLPDNQLQLRLYGLFICSIFCNKTQVADTFIWKKIFAELVLQANTVSSGMWLVILGYTILLPFYPAGRNPAWYQLASFFNWRIKFMPNLPCSNRLLA